MIQDRDIKYTGRDFTSLRQQLVEYTKNYFPNTYNDFSPTSPGMMFMEMAAYVGDVLSFYQDMQLQETYLQYTKEKSNLYNLAYLTGYRPKVTHAAEVDVEISQLVDSVAAAPDWSQAAQIGTGLILSSNSRNQVKFYINTPVDFTFSSSYSPTDVTVAAIEGGSPSQFLLTKKVKAYSGEVKTTTIDVGSAQPFNTFTLRDSKIIGILSIVDSNNNNWYEVPMLGQDTIFLDEVNNSSDSGSVPYSLNLQRVPRRFVTRFDPEDNLVVQFGAGIAGASDEIFTPDPTNVGLGATGVLPKLDYAYDPSNFIYTQAYGLAPSNTTLTVTYIVGGGIEANVPANTLTNIVTIPANSVGELNALSVNNPEPASGGRDADTVEELRQNALRAFNEQGRAVTLQDYTVRALSLPPKYGTIGKVYVTQDESENYSIDTSSTTNPLALSLYTLAYDNEMHLINTTPTLKDNLRKYLAEYMILTDAVTIKDAFVINVGVNFDIIARPGFLGRDVLLECNTALQDFFDIKKWSINQPINLSTIYTLLDQVKGVQTVQKVEITNLTGGLYSEFAYDIQGATRNNIVYPSLDPMIFEVKYPTTDIKGRITTL